MVKEDVICWTCSTHGKKWRERTRLLGGPRRRREDSVKMDLKEIGWEVVD
jgi:hypothetical protein